MVLVILINTFSRWSPWYFHWDITCLDKLHCDVWMFGLKSLALVLLNDNACHFYLSLMLFLEMFYVDKWRRCRFPILPIYEFDPHFTQTFFFREEEKTVVLLPQHNLSDNQTTQHLHIIAYFLLLFSSFLHLFYSHTHHITSNQ